MIQIKWLTILGNTLELQIIYFIPYLNYGMKDAI